MNSSDKIALSSARGRVKGSWIRRTGGAVHPAFDIHNTMSYSAADVLAEAYGGDVSRVPKYIGFIYNQGEEPATLGPITRDMDFRTIDNLCQGITGNMQVVRFSRKPSVGTYTFDDEDGSENSAESQEAAGRYRGNVVEFSAISRTDKDGIYANDTNGGSDYCGRLSDGNYIYRAVLLGDGPNPCGDEPYTVLAMVDLAKNNVFRKKPEGYELSLDWRVSFE